MPNVLLVEDYLPLRENIREQLEVAGYQIRAVEHGVQALELLTVFRPDVIVCDILMPHMDGLDLLKAIKQHALHRSIPLIFLTACSTPEDRLEGLKLGAIDYICKPFSIQELLLKVSNIITQQTELVRHQLQASIAQETIDIEFVNLFNRQLEQSYSEALFNADQMARALAMSLSALQRNLKRYFNSNFSQLLKEYRLVKASNYLRHTDRSLDWVATRCGFGSLSSFSRSFKEAYGLAPLRYRQQNRDALTTYVD